MNLTDELQKLEQLHQSGAIDDDEFTLAKAKLLNGSSVAAPGKAPLFEEFGSDPAALDKQARQWGFLLHISVLAGFAVPIAGLIVPIVIWQLMKPTVPGIDEHGKNVVNW